MDDRLDFAVPSELEAGAPPEERGLRRDEVRLMISYRVGDRVVHTRFSELPCYLAPGDVLVINTSGTLKAALPAMRPGQQVFELHLSTPLPGGLWSVELGRPGEQGTTPYFAARAGECYALPGGGARRWSRPTWTTGAHDRWDASGCGWRHWLYPSRSKVTWNATAFRSATVMSKPGGRLRTTKTCTPRNRAARRCPRPDGRSARS